MKKNRAVILICIFVIALSALYVTKSIINKGNLTASYFEEYNKIKQTYEAMFEHLKYKKEYEAKEQDLQDDINDLNLLKALDQDEIIIILDECIKAGNLMVSNIAFSEIKQISLSAENELIEYTLEAESNDLSNFPIEMINVHIEFNSTYDDMILFVDKLQGYETEICITNISILNEEGERVYCTIDLSFYAM